MLIFPPYRILEYCVLLFYNPRSPFLAWIKCDSVHMINSRCTRHVMKLVWVSGLVATQRPRRQVTAATLQQWPLVGVSIPWLLREKLASNLGQVCVTKLGPGQDDLRKNFRKYVNTLFATIDRSIDFGVIQNWRL